MKILVFVAHPGLNEVAYGATSRINKTLIAAIQGKENITIVDLSKNYNIIEHQKLMQEHDRIVLQFPIFWFNMPGLAKKWLDDALAFDFAYGSVFKLEGKEFMLGLTSGQAAKSYQKDGHIGFTLNELFTSLKITASYCKMKYLPYFHTGNAHHITDSELDQAAKDYHNHITKTY